MAHLQNRCSISEILGHAFASIVLAVFLFIAIARVQETGVCCADDAVFAAIAKNLAWGYGYANTVGYHSSAFATTPFDPTMQTGPTLLLPTAASIWLFGNQYWVPGITLIVIWLSLLLCTYKTLCSVLHSLRVSVAGGVFLLWVYALSPWHFEQWWALLGEVPAALLSMLGYSIWAVNPQGKGRIAAASIIIGLAVTAKLLAMLYVVVFVLAVLVCNISGNDRVDRLKSGLLNACVAGALCLAPLVCFEVWKIVTLGITEYLHNVRGFLAFFQSQALHSNTQVLAMLGGRVEEFNMNFGVSLWVILSAAVCSATVALIIPTTWCLRMATMVLFALIIHLTYWLFFSVGWPRYVYSGVILMCFLVAMPILIIDTARGYLVYAVLTVMSLSGPLQRIHYPLGGGGRSWFSASPERQSQELVTTFLNAHLDRRPFVAQWGGSIADLEYLSKGVANFTGYLGFYPNKSNGGALVVKNSKWDHFGQAEDRKFSDLISSCGRPVLVAKPFVVYDCIAFGK